jgi:ribosomal protein L31E
MLDAGTTAAYAPPPALYEQADRLGGEQAPPRQVSAGVASATTELRLVKPAPDPEKQYVAERASKHEVYRQANAELEIRLSDLVREAVWEREPWSQASLSDLRLFMSQVSFKRRPSVYLLENGNFRAVWKNTENEQAAFQFRGDGIIQCVFFSKRASAQLPLNRETLIDVLPKVRARVMEFERLLQG